MTHFFMGLSRLEHREPVQSVLFGADALDFLIRVITR